MCIKRTSMVIMLTILGCGGSALQGLPKLADGTESRWIYYCEQGGRLAVEYANRGGRHSATLELEEGNRVLEVVPQQDGSIVAVLEPLVWLSSNGELFRLERNDEVIFDQCRALREEKIGNIRINFGSSKH